MYQMQLMSERQLTCSKTTYFLRPPESLKVSLIVSSVHNTGNVKCGKKQE